MACKSGVNTVPKEVKNAAHIIIFPFKSFLFPTDKTLVESLLKACDCMTHNTKRRRQLQN